MQSVLAAEQAAAKANLAERQAKERHQVRMKFRPYPDLEEWHRQREHPHLAEQWRYRAHEPQGMEGEGDDSRGGATSGDYLATVQGREVHYTHKALASRETGVTFIDRGRRIDIHDWRSRESVLAALQLSQQKWGVITVTGNDAYKAMCADLAAEHKFRVVNPELQARIAEQRQVQRRREPSISERQPQRPSRQEKQQPRDFDITD